MHYNLAQVELRIRKKIGPGVLMDQQNVSHVSLNH